MQRAMPVATGVPFLTSWVRTSSGAAWNANRLSTTHVWTSLKPVSMGTFAAIANSPTANAVGDEMVTVMIDTLPLA